MTSVSDCITSFIDGRVRLRHPALKNPELAEMAAAAVAGVEGVENVRVNPVTGSLLLFYDPARLSREELLQLAEESAAFLPGEEKKPEGRSACRCAGALLGRRATRLVDHALLVSLLCSLAGAAAGMGAVHRIAGTVFALAGLQHVAAHRRAFW